MKLRLFGLSREEKKEVYGDEALAKIGLNVLTGMTLHERVEKLKEYYERFKNAKTPLERLEALDSAVNEVIVPWGRGADRSEFLEMIQAWAGIVGLVRSWMRLLEDESIDPKRRKELSYILDAIVKEEVYSAWIIVVAATFGKEDLAKNIVAVIHNIPGPQGPMPVQSSLTHILHNVRGEKR